MAWGMHGGASTAPGTAGGHYAGPGYIGNQSPAHHSPYIKNEAEIKQDILDARQKQLYGWGSSGFKQGGIGVPTPTQPQSRSPISLRTFIDLLQGRIGNSQASFDANARRVNVNVPLLNMGGGLLSGQGSYSPYGNNYLGFQYRKDW